MKSEICVLNQNTKLHYFDYAATSFMCKSALEAYNRFNSETGVLFGKGFNCLSSRSRTVFENALQRIRRHFLFDGAYSMIIGKNATELINMVALSLESYIDPMDIILVGPYEHHSNHLPWKYLAKRRNAVFFELPLNAQGALNTDYLKSISGRVKVLAYSSIANTNGHCIEPDDLLDSLSQQTLVFVDESQKVAHAPLSHDMRISGHILSSHKMYGPKNIAGAFIRNDILERMEPVFLGGGMIDTQGFTDTWRKGVDKFYSGTYDVGLIDAWAEACSFIQSVGYDAIQRHEADCLERVKNTLRAISGVRITDTGKNAESLLSFKSEFHHPHDIESFLANNDVIIRTGNLCSQNSLRKAGFISLNRVSFGVATDEEDLHALETSLTEYL
jgi:cysteine desulfurase/selenocysteine lyase